MTFWIDNKVGQEQSGIWGQLPLTRRIPGRFKVNCGIMHYGVKEWATATLKLVGTIIKMMTGKDDLVENHEVEQEQFGIRCALPSTRRFAGRTFQSQFLSNGLRWKPVRNSNIKTGPDDDIKAGKITLWRIMRWWKDNPASGGDYPQLGAFPDNSKSHPGIMHYSGNQWGT